jgi:hypothetical protein
MGDQRGGVGFLHFHQADDHRLAGLQQQVQELGRHLVIVALVGSDVDEDIGQPRNLEQSRHVIGGRPGRHVRAVPDNEVFQQAGVRGIWVDTPHLIDILIQTGRGNIG